MAGERTECDGGFIAGTPGHHAIYTHAICTLALSEAYAMTNDTWLKRYVELGIKFTLRAQSKKGGWRYEFASSDSDTSVTVCVHDGAGERQVGRD